MSSTEVPIPAGQPQAPAAGAVPPALAARLNRHPSIADLERAARRRLPKFAWDYLAGGAGDESGIARNRAAYDAVRFVPRYLVERRPCATAATVFGRTYDLPLGVAPVGQSGLIWPRAAEYLAAAAKKANIPFCLSMVATTGIERIGEIAGANAWFQLYPLRDPAVMRDVVRRAGEAGFSVLVVTVDTPAARRTLRDLRNGLTVPPRLSVANLARIAAHPAWALATARAGMPRFETVLPYFPKDADVTGVLALTRTVLRQGLGPKALEQVRAAWDGPLVVKGPLGVDDALVCRDIGVNGLILSNHGGRQSEALVSPLEVLARVRDAVGDALTLMVDSGARSGLDVARALAMGAEFVFLGRAFMFAVAALGERGAEHATALLRLELEQAMGQIGCFDWRELPKYRADG